MATEEKVYLNLDLLQENEDPRFYEMNDLCENRIEVKRVEDESSGQRKKIDKQLKDYVESWGVDGVIVGDKLIQRVESSSGGKWNENLLNTWLSPKQLAQAFTPGKRYAFIKVISNEKQVDKAREASKEV